MRLFSCKIKPGTCVRNHSNYYEHAAAYAGDTLIVLKDYQIVTQTLLNNYEFKSKGRGTITCYLEYDFFRDNSKIMCLSPRKYTNTIVSKYEALFGPKLNVKVKFTLKKDDYSELGALMFLGTAGG